MKKILYVDNEDMSEAERLAFQAELNDNEIQVVRRSASRLDLDKWVEVAQENDCVVIASSTPVGMMMLYLSDSPIPVYKTAVHHIISTREKDGEEEYFIDHFGIERVV